MFVDKLSIKSSSWQAFERTVSRLLLYEGYEGIRIVGQKGDHGADIIARKYGKRWLFQVKFWQNTVGIAVVDETLKAMSYYKSQVPVIVALNGFDSAVYEHQRVLQSRGIPLQLWDINTLIEKIKRLPDECPNKRKIREYQEEAISIIVQQFIEGFDKRSLIVMATGLGKTFVAGETLRRINKLKPSRVLILAHTNDLIYQLERSFWQFLTPKQETVIWNQYERLEIAKLERTEMVFGCVDTVSGYIKNGNRLPDFDIVLIDECHHVGAEMYERIFNETRAGQKGGPFVIGLTATPWRADEIDLSKYFGKPKVSIDIVAGLKKGFLSNVDYRLYTDNINWDALKNLNGASFSPRQINRTLFINQWDDAVVFELKSVWKEQSKPRAIIFCGTIDHAVTMRDRINSLRFCNAAAIYSQSSAGFSMNQYERNQILSDFGDGMIDVVCAVDVFNEGIDVPDVNILVFQRVTHSRRIFVQQLGRGLRISEDKVKVIVLDFVSDIRRFAAGIDLKDHIDPELSSSRGPVRIELPHKVTFRKVGGEDKETENFLRIWLEDVTAIEDAGDDTSILRYPPLLPGGKL